MHIHTNTLINHHFPGAHALANCPFAPLSWGVSGQTFVWMDTTPDANYEILLLVFIFLSYAYPDKSELTLLLHSLMSVSLTTKNADQK